MLMIIALLCCDSRSSCPCSCSPSCFWFVVRVVILVVFAVALEIQGAVYYAAA